jgi:hypothetical protein
VQALKHATQQIIAPFLATSALLRLPAASTTLWTISLIQIKVHAAKRVPTEAVVLRFALGFVLMMTMMMMKNVFCCSSAFQRAAISRLVEQSWFI